MLFRSFISANVVTSLSSACLIALLMVPESSAATIKDYSFSESPDLLGHAATARFSLDPETPDRLFLELTNNSRGITHSATDVLLGLFFNCNSSIAEEGATAELLPGSSVIAPLEEVDPGDGWEFQNNINIAGYTMGIAGAGYGVFGPDGNLNPGGPPQKLDGSDFGIVGINHNQALVNGSVTTPLFKNGLKFTFKVDSGFNLDMLGNVVRFQYGTSLDEPFFDVDPPPSIPEPSTIWLCGIGCLMGVTCWLYGLGRQRGAGLDRFRSGTL